MKLIQLTVPDAKVSEVSTFLDTDLFVVGDSLLQFLASHGTTVLQFRVEDDHASFVLASLQRLGLGITFEGYCDVIDLKASTYQLSRPLLSNKQRIIDSSSSSVVKSSSPLLSPSQMYLNISRKTPLTTDTAVIVVVSSVMAGIGLAVNNRLYIMAGSILSRAMCPILGASYGLAVLDRGLFTSGVKNYVLHILLTMSVGAVLGSVFSPFASSLLWPTDEMAKRGVYVEILFGALVAICGGAAVAVSESNEDLGALSGVAIASAIVPPAVNVGLCAAFLFVGPMAVPTYEIDTELFVSIAISSMANVVINSFCIYATAFFVFRLRGGGSQNNLKFKFGMQRGKQGKTDTRKSSEGSSRGRTMFSNRGDRLEEVLRSRAKSR